MAALCAAQKQNHDSSQSRSASGPRTVRGGERKKARRAAGWDASGTAGQGGKEVLSAKLAGGWCGLGCLNPNQNCRDLDLICGVGVTVCKHLPPQQHEVSKEREVAGRRATTLCSTKALHRICQVGDLVGQQCRTLRGGAEQRGHFS